MKLITIHTFEDFCNNLYRIGFTIGGRDSRGIFTLADYYSNSIQTYTGDPQTDPREWRMRILQERDDIAYSKIFFKRSGYITRRWYPFFLKVRQEGLTAEEAYWNGTISSNAYRIYQSFSPRESISLTDLREKSNFSKTEAAKFEQGLLELQMKLYVTICGNTKKRSIHGEEVGWSINSFCRSEDFFPSWVWEQSYKLSLAEAVQSIEDQIKLVNPELTKRALLKFLGYK